MTLIRRFLLALPMLATAALAQNAPLTIDSRYDFAATVTALETAIQEKGMTLFPYRPSGGGERGRTRHAACHRPYLRLA